MKTTTIKKLAAVSAAIICLASCGKVDDITPKEGKATLTTTTTAAVEETTTAETEAEPNELEENADESSKEDEKSEETKKNDKKKVTTAKKAETTTAKKAAATTSAAKKAAATTTTKKAAATTTTKATTTTTTTTTTTSATTPAPEPEPQPGQSCTDFVDGCRIVYNGYEFGIGDGIDGVSPNLGEQIAPSEEMQSCQDGHTSTVYHFSGMDVSAYNGVIYEVHFDAAYNTTGANIRLKAGPGLGSSADDITAAFGNEFGFSGGGDFFSYDSNGYHLQMNLDGSGVYFLLLQCPALG